LPSVVTPVGVAAAAEEAETPVDATDEPLAAPEETKLPHFPKPFWQPVPQWPAELPQ
jgi:hypothetical protein